MATEQGLTYAMVGGGIDAFIGEVHRKAIALDNSATLVAGALSSTPERSRESAKQLGLPEDRSYATWQELVEQESKRDDGVDFVVIVTPNNTHHPIAKACLEAGLNVVLDKPMTTTSEEARELAHLANDNGLVCGVTYTYTGYPMIREAAELVRNGTLGNIRRVELRYLQGWLANDIESEGQKQASWRMDPKQAGAGGTLGDIGTHAEHLAAFVTGLEIQSLSAELTSFVDGRVLDDDTAVRVRYEGGAKGTYLATQVLIGEENTITLSVYGDKGSLWWTNGNANDLKVSTLERGTYFLTRGQDSLSERAKAATRTPPGHPEGYLEAFANIYRGVAELINAQKLGTPVGPLGHDVPGPEAGLCGMRFVERVVSSSTQDGAWV
ncbi:MAG: gfo/Idh/MocA family oxidoreductase [Phycisphaera sp.]|nr:MAG: gfo/Idh/MocA family oxidoreductase [Phycisphaera sp.]